MPATFEELRVLKTAEEIADLLWKQVLKWDRFAQDVVGKQLARAGDSIGANIAESFGRYHFGEKLQFLYFARGSLFETKYWLNRVLVRGLISTKEAKDYGSRLTELARQLNAFASSLKQARHEAPNQSKTVREDAGIYLADSSETAPHLLFSEQDLNWLELQPSITNN